MEKEFFKFEIDGKQFQRAYMVYIVRLISSKHGEYYYVGQTGDRYHLTARPAFRRLAGHLSEQGRSTENQIYRQIAVKILGIENADKKQTFPIETKNAVAAFLAESKIEMYAYPLVKFLPETSLEEHKSNRQLVEKIENELMNYFSEKSHGDRILNKKIKPTKERHTLTSDIIRNFERG